MLRASPVLTLLAAAAGVTACAAGAHAPPGPPTVVAAPGQPAPPQARFYADCVAQAAAARTYDREGNTLRFRCSGEPARVFYDGLAAWSARQHSELSAEGRTWRFTQRIQRNPSGLDYCSTDGAGDHRCNVVLNVGEFLAFE